MANGAALPEPNPLDRILSAHIKAFTYLIQGAADYGQRVQFTQYTDTTNYANTFGNVDTTNGRAVQIQYGPAASPTTLMTFAKDALTASASLIASITSSTLWAGTFKNANTANGLGLLVQDPAGGLDVFKVRRSATGRNIVVSNQQNASLPTESFWLIADAPTETTFITQDVVVSSVGTGKDHGAIRGAASQSDSSGNNLIRALEGRASRLAPAAISGTWGMELNVTSTVAGSDPTHLVGAYIAGGSGVASEVRSDSALWIGGPAGWKSAIDYYETDNTTRLFRVDQTGRVYARAGTAALPSYTFTTSAIDGMYLVGAGSLGFSANGVFRLGLSANGATIDVPLLVKHTASGATAAGYDTAYPKSDGRWYHDGDSTAEAQFMDAAVDQRKNRLINGDMRVKQRAAMPTTDNTYALDGVKLLLEAANAATIAQETSDVPTGGSRAAVKLTVGSGEDNKFGILIPVYGQDMWDLRSGTASLQAKMKVSNTRIGDVRMALLNWVGTENGHATTPNSLTDPITTWGSAGAGITTYATSWSEANTPANLSVTTSWATYKVEGISVSASATNLAVFIWCDDESVDVGDILYITDVQLEKGSVCTDVERRPYADQLTDCEHFLQVFVGGNYPIQVFGAGTNATTAAFGPLIRRSMRTAPTLSVTVADWSIYQTEAAIALTDLTILYANRTGVWMRGTAAAGITANAALFLSSTAAASSDLILTAEL